MKNPSKVKFTALILLVVQSFILRFVRHLDGDLNIPIVKILFHSMIFWIFCDVLIQKTFALKLIQQP